MSDMPTQKAETWLRDKAMACEGATEDFPWGHRAIKVKGKMFLILSGEKGEFSVTAKLPQSGTRMLDLAYCQPTGYGMGKHGWVTATWSTGDRVPLDVIEPWIAESYRAVLEGAKKKSGTRKKGSAKTARAKPTTAAPAKKAGKTSAREAAKKPATTARKTAARGKRA